MASKQRSPPTTPHRCARRAERERRGGCRTWGQRAAPKLLLVTA
ncbi:hypothetical protein ERO13_D07G212601v2 [Gossypium hirsutum]|uniref:Uncharacterized protein n=2 Tax=Gossypium TaxID=3633 RepID=A0A5J5QUU9_GOSBA|nr:hypothetical protein ES319_D07G235100v1 [Gossypium barbadense]KAG4139748.1 hypothetical protein ERO13_D07G212601v2 [Gossypium hirsutum]TYG62701.1 hypothetical protein ES288_D07G252900v1 [Gossypium darwinii]